MKRTRSTRPPRGRRRVSDARLETLFDHNPLSTQVFAPDGTTIAVNPAWEALWGASLEQIADYNVRRDPQLVAKGIAPYIERGFAGESLAIPAIRYDPEETLPGRTRHVDPRRWVRAFIYPVKDPSGELREVVLIHEDVTAQKLAEQRLALQYAVSSAIATADSLAAAAPAILRALGATLEWPYAGLWLVDPGIEALRMAHMWSLPSPALGLFEQASRERVFPRGKGLPGEVWASGEPVWITDVARHPNFPRRDAAAAAGLHSGFGFPIALPDGRVFGVLECFSPAHELLDDALRHLLVSLGQQIGQFVERTRVQADIRTSEIRRSAIIQTSLDAIIMIDQAGRVLEFNRAAEEIFGYSADDVLGRPLADLIVPERLRDEHRRGLARYTATGEARVLGRRLELPALKADGTEIPVELAIAPIPGPGAPQFAGYLRDITERRRADQALRDALDASVRAQRAQGVAAEQLARVQRLTAGLSGAVAPGQVLEIIVDHALGSFGTAAASVVLFSDDRRSLEVVRASGYSESVLRPWQTMPVETAAPIPDSARSGELLLFSSSVELLARYPNLAGVIQESGFAAWAAVPLLLQDETLGAMGLSFSASRDFAPEEVTLLRAIGRLSGQALDRARLYERERRARSEAEAANRSKDEFLAMVSHELRTPLNAVLGWARMVRGGTLDADTTGRGLEAIERNARVQAQLIDDLLDVSRIIAGKLRLEVEPFDLPAVVAAAIEAVQPAARAKEVALTVDVSPSAGIITGDPRRVQQVLWNLLSNGIKFTPRGGCVEVRVARSGQWVEIGVSDTGVGVPKDMLLTIFERFRQADSSSTRGHGGLGLGLAIVRHIVELHGGSVFAESRGEGQGARFRVRVPVQGPPLDVTRAAVVAVAAPAPAVSGNGQLAGLRVLLVDDDADAREVAGLMLAPAGADVRVAASAAEGLRLLDGWEADVLVSDIAMPIEDGYSLIKRVRAHPHERVRSIGALAVTAYAAAGDRDRALQQGFDMHIAKPIEPENLIATLTELVERRRGRRSR